MLATWQETVTAVAAGAGALGLGLVWYQLKEARTSRNAETLLELSSRWESPELREARRLSWEHRDDLKDRLLQWSDVNAPDYYKLVCEANFFEDLGTMVAVAAIDFRILELVYGLAITERWQRWEEAVKAVRLKEQDDSWYENFELLANRMEQALQQRGAGLARRLGHRLISSMRRVLTIVKPG